MNKNIIISDNPEMFVKTIKEDFDEMTGGNVLQKEAVEYVTNALSLARACHHDPKYWFWMYDEPEKMPSDARVEYVYEPTYMMTGIVIYALTKYEAVKNIPGIFEILEKVLNGSMGRQFCGSGYDRTEGFLKAMKIFAVANVRGFIQEYAEMYPEFTEFFERMEKYLREEIVTGKVKAAWSGEDYVEEADEIIKIMDGK